MDTELMNESVRLYRRHGEEDGQKDSQGKDPLAMLIVTVEKSDKRITALEVKRYQTLTTEERDRLEIELAAEREYMVAYVQSFAHAHTH